jgi:phosphoglycolate phosphatase
MHILFDLDGTLTDPFDGITNCISHALSELGRTPPPRNRLKWCIGPPLADSFRQLLGTKEHHIIREAVELYRQRFARVGLFENKVYPGITDALEKLSSTNHLLYVATSKPAVFAERIIDHFNMRQYFTAIYGSELDGRNSDKAELIKVVLDNENIEPHRAVMIGDRKHDIIGAHRNNMRCLAVFWGYGTKDELELAGADALIPTTEELVASCLSNARRTWTPE